MSVFESIKIRDDSIGYHKFCTALCTLNMLQPRTTRDTDKLPQILEPIISYSVALYIKGLGEVVISSKYRNPVRSMIKVSRDHFMGIK